MSTDSRGLRVTRLDTTLAGDEGGQISALAVLGAAAFACLLILMINTGWSTSSKIGMQNAADATAVSGATWVARGLNVISINNITSAQILAIAVVIKALDDNAIGLALKVLQVQRDVGCPLLLAGAAVCAGIIQVQIVFLEGLDKGVSAVAPMADKSSGLLWQAMLALQKISRVVKNTFVLMAEIEADRIARQNGAGLGLLVPASLSLQLPVRDGGMKPYLCEQARTRLQHYTDPLNLVFIPVANSLIHLFFYEAKERTFRNWCGGSAGLASEGREIQTLAQCRVAGGGVVHWAVIDYEKETDSRSMPSDMGEGREGSPDKVVPKDCNWPSIRATGGRGEVVPFNRPVEEKRVGEVTRYVHRMTEYRLLSIRTHGSTVPPPEKLPDAALNPDEPNPLILEEDAEDKLKYLAVVYREQSGMVAPEYFRSAVGRHRLAYAQARVYNATKMDTFTQDWRVTLEPASMVELNPLFDSLSSGTFGSSGQSTVFRVLQQATNLIGALGRDLNMVRFLNSH